MATEKRLIDAKQYHFRLSQIGMNELFPDWNELPSDVRNMLCKLAKEHERQLFATPTVDAVEVVHGRWEVVKGVFTPGGDPLLRCPICKSRESEHICGVECFHVWNYCPNCGAKMDGDGNG